jgi:hypothetical protein
MRSMPFRLMGFSATLSAALAAPLATLSPLQVAHAADAIQSTPAPSAKPADAPASTPVTDRLKRDSAAFGAIVAIDLAKRFLAAANRSSRARTR